MADPRPLLDSYSIYIDGRWVDHGCIPGDAPFGGFKQSGLGREGGGLPDLHQYMEPKAIGIPA